MTETRKKVLFLITKASWGGAQRYVYDLALGLPTDAFEPIIAVGGEGDLVDKLREKGLKVYVLSGLKRDISFLDELRALWDILRIIRTEKPDVLHVNSSKAGAFGALLGRICRVPKIIFTALGWAFNEDRPQWQLFIFKTIQWITVLLSHQTIAISHGMKVQMNWPLAKRKLKVIHLGRKISDMRTKEDARGILEMKVIDTDARLIDYHNDLWVGTIAELHPIKRINRAIDSISALTKKFPSIRFVIIHDGQEKQKLQEQVRNLGLEEHVFFTGKIDEAARLLPAFDLFVLPSKSEAFGYVLIEAGYAGVPVVATNVGGIPDVVIDNETGLLVPPDNTPELTRAMSTLLYDEKLRTQFALAHQERSKTFTLEHMLAQTIKLYRS